MSIRPIDNHYHVSGQISPAMIADIKAKGYTSIICLRPDNETAGQPSFAEIKAEAEKQGMTAHYLPVTPGSMPHDKASTLKKLLATTPGPVLAYCASGNRALVVYQLSQQAA